eukprot:9740334-Lingulodinium_polyedra.AAC.1
MTHSHGDRISAVSWNAKWLVDPQATCTRNKKPEIEAALDSGKPVLLQETHWTPHSEALWRSGVLLDATITSSPARRGANGGPSG